MTLTPYMPQREIAMMDAIFAMVRPKRVLEFGAGGSTVRWSDFVTVERWVSIEHNQEWVERVRRESSARVFKVPGDSWAHYSDFVLEDKFDLIFIDGLHRVECVKASPQWLAPGGIVVLHDAARTKYAEAWGVYPHKAMLTKGDRDRNGLMVMWR